MERKIIVAIDGFSACGKSTLARQLAEALQYIYLDTGAMYRAITFYLIGNDIPLEDGEELQNALKKIVLSFDKKKETAGKKEICLNGKNVEEEIRKMEDSVKVREVAALPAVRKIAVEEQRNIGKKSGVVMDGRDIGTVVFPDAELKIFLTAKPEIRIERRLAELRMQNPNIRRGDVQKNLEQRDYMDTHRKDSPLRRAEDDVVIDNRHM